MAKESGKALDALKFALKFEMDGYKFYTKASKKTKNVLGKEMFKYIAEEEMKHVEMVKAIYENLKKTKKWPQASKGRKKEKKKISFETIFTSLKEEIKEILDINPSDIEAVKIAKDMEIDGYKFYQKRAEQTDNPLEREFYQQLVKEESNHYEVLNNTYEYLSNPGDWFSKKERPIYEGG